MKIFFFIDSFSTGGKERRLLELMKGLRMQPDIEFELIVMSNDVHYKEVFDLGIKIHFIVRKSKRDFSIFSQFYRLCKNGKPDIVHCWDSMTVVYLVPVSKLLGIKFVNGMVVDSPSKLNIHNKNWLRAKLTFPFSHVIIGNSRAGLHAYGASKRKSVCIYNGFNFNRAEGLINRQLILDELGIKTKFIVGMVATFSEFKDYPTYYKAAELLLRKRNDITFLAIGDYTDADESRNLISHEFVENFRFLGRRSGIESFINVMDICVLSTYTEGISNSILEYMALGKPVIATDGGGTNEIVEDKQTGFLISSVNPTALAEKMEILLNDSSLRTKMGMAGMEKIKNQFLLKNMVNSFIVNYQKVVSK